MDAHESTKSFSKGYGLFSQLRQLTVPCVLHRIADELAWVEPRGYQIHALFLLTVTAGGKFGLQTDRVDAVSVY